MSWIATDEVTRTKAPFEPWARIRRRTTTKTRGTQIGNTYPLTNMLSAPLVLRWFGLDTKKYKIGNADELIVAAIQWAEKREAKGPVFWSTVARAIWPQYTVISPRLNRPRLGPRGALPVRRQQIEEKALEITLYPNSLRISCGGLTSAACLVIGAQSVTYLSDLLSVTQSCDKTTTREVVTKIEFTAH